MELNTDNKANVEQLVIILIKTIDWNYHRESLYNLP